jgi:hypothetical protein
MYIATDSENRKALKTDSSGTSKIGVKKTKAGLKNRIAKKPQNKYSHVTIPSHCFIYFFIFISR